MSHDPHNLQRFTQLQEQHFEDALQEIRNGQKRGHWSWFILPTPPYVVNGREVGSPMNREFALRSDEEGIAYLRFRDGSVNLRQNYFDIMVSIRDQLRAGNPAL